MSGRHRRGDPTALSGPERSALVYSTGLRLIGTPVVALCGLASTAVVVRATGEGVYGLVSLVATVGLLLPFADLGIGAVVTTAVSKSADPVRDLHVRAVVRRAYTVVLLVATVVSVLAALVCVVDGWSTLVGIRSGPDDRWAITIAVMVWAWTIPAALSLRILIGSGRNHHAVVVTMSASVLGLILVVAADLLGVRGIWFVLPPLLAALITNLGGTLWTVRVVGAAMLSSPSSRDGRTPRVRTAVLLQGSLWLFVISIGIPFGLQVQRVVLAHLSTPLDLSAYALAAQLYGAVWSVFSTAAAALWPIFASRSSVPEILGLWRRYMVMFAAAAIACAVPFAVVAPTAARVLSGSRIDISFSLAAAFAILLVVQIAHLPTGVLLVQSDEARWQAFCLVAMASVTTVGSVLVAPYWGATGVVAVTALSVAVCQLMPGLRGAPGLVSRRSPATAVVVSPQGA